MTKYLLVLPDGTEISSGAGMVNALASITVTELVNSDTELTMGSVCAAILEATIITPDAGLNIAAGAEVALYKVDDLGGRVKVGQFTAEKPTRPSAHRYKITAYDRVSWLDKDLTEWLSSLDGWPYSTYSLAVMVCGACGLTLATQSIPNGDFLVRQCPSVSGVVTGRQIMRWIAEIAGRFVTANQDGEIVFGWYAASDITVAPSGGNYFFGGGLSYEDYQVEPVDAVKIRLSDSESGGALWPAGEAENPYIISGNRLLANVTAVPQSVFDVMLSSVRAVQYTPCKVSAPASCGIRAGDLFAVMDSNGVRLTACAMKVTRTGQRVTVESTGSARRNSSESMNYLSNQDMKDYADSAANGAVQAQTQEDVYNKLTNNGEAQGVYLQDGKLYLNASFIGAGFISADIIRAGHIRSTDFSVEDLKEIYPFGDLYPSVDAYPNNGEQIIQGFEIDFDSGVIRGVFWSDSIAALQDKVLSLENQLALSEGAISRLEKENAELQSEIKSLQIEVSYLEADYAGHQEAIRNLEFQVVDLQITVDNLGSRLTELANAPVYPISV